MLFQMSKSSKQFIGNDNYHTRCAPPNCFGKAAHAVGDCTKLLNLTHTILHPKLLVNYHSLPYT